MPNSLYNSMSRYGGQPHTGYGGEATSAYKAPPKSTSQWSAPAGGSTPYGNAKEAAAGDQQAYLQGLIENNLGNPDYFLPGQQFDPLQSLWGYYTWGMNADKPWLQAATDKQNELTKNAYGQAQSNLYGQQQRDVGSQGALAANQAFASGVSNPYAFQHHAQNNVYGNYAQAFGGLQGNYLQQLMQNPQIIQQSEQQRNTQNFQNLYQILALKSGLVSQRDPGIAQQVVGGAAAGGTKAALA